MIGQTYEMTYYSSGFFGFGEKGNFQQWSLAHILPILLLIAAIILIYKKRDAVRNWKHEESFRFIFAAVMLLCEMSYFWRLLYVGQADNTYRTMLTKLPLQVCQWSLILCCFMMMKKSQALFSMCFFLTLSFGLLPLAVPAVIERTGPGYYRYYQFWGEHLLPVFGVFYMMFVHGFRPKKRGMLLAYGMILVIFPFAIYFNSRVEGASYLYLTNLSDFSMLSFMPDSILAAALLFSAVVWALFGLDWLIYRLVRRRNA